MQEGRWRSAEPPGETKGRAEEAARAVLTVLRVRTIVHLGSAERVASSRHAREPDLLSLCAAFAGGRACDWPPHHALAEDRRRGRAGCARRAPQLRRHARDPPPPPCPHRRRPPPRREDRRRR